MMDLTSTRSHKASGLVLIALALVSTAFVSHASPEDFQTASPNADYIIGVAPDYIIYDAKIVTVDSEFSIRSAAAVTNGRFGLVGTKQEVFATAGPNTKKIDMHGQTVLPGFNDTHQHQSGQGEGLAVQVDLSKNIRSIADIQKAIANRVEASKPDEWIRGTRGWWQYKLTDGRLPNRRDLDKVSPHNPVAIPGPHYLIVNSLALKRAGITKNTKNPAGGIIVKDPDTGELTGQLIDSARDLVPPLKLSRAEKLKGIKKTMALNNAHGITSVGDPNGSMASFNLYRDLYEMDELTTRVDVAFKVSPLNSLEKVRKHLQKLGRPGHYYGDGMLRADEVGEAYLDGAAPTALLREDDPVPDSFSQTPPKVPQDKYNKFALAVAKAGYRLRPHVVGDAAIDEALKAYNYANERQAITGRRWMLDHAFLLRKDQYESVKTLGLILNSQYMHTAQYGRAILRSWHRPLADKMENYKDWIAAGLLIAGGSDGPISYHSYPLYEIYGDITRNTMWDGQLAPDQGISREQAIRTVTINGAYTTFEENLKGSIEPGKYADFVVLSDDIMTVPAEEIKDIKVNTTVLGGRAVYGTLPSADSYQ